jgi:hypothetical protein
LDSFSFVLEANWCCKIDATHFSDFNALQTYTNRSAQHERNTAFLALFAQTRWREPAGLFQTLMTK